MKKYGILTSICFLGLACKVYAVPGIDPANVGVATAVSGAYGTVRMGAGLFLELKESAAKNYEAAQAALVMEIETQKKAQIAAVTLALKQNATAIAAHNNSLLYSPLAESSFACPDKERSRGVVIGSRALPSGRDTIYQKLLDSNRQANSRNQSYETMSDDARQFGSKAGRILIPSSNTMSDEELADAAKVASMVTNPDPDYDLLPDRFTQKADAQKYQALRRMKLAKISLSQEVIADIITRKTALYPMADWMQEMSQLSGVIGVHQEDLKKDKLSADTVLEMEVASRYANPAYLTDLHRKTEAGVLRELLAGEAINMEFQRLEMKHQQYMAALTALRASSAAQHLNDNLKENYNISIIQQK